MTGANRHAVAVADVLTEDIVGCYVLQDRGYDSNKNRQNIIALNNVTVIPSKEEQKDRNPIR